MELAPKWEIEAVLDALRDRKRVRLAQFIETRYQTRFFEPISILEKEAVRGICWKKGDSDPREPIRPYGFAIMSLACQMIETLESYQRGIYPLPTGMTLSGSCARATILSVPRRSSARRRTFRELVKPLRVSS